MVAGRNAVAEALRAGVPGTALYVAHRIESDDRVRAAIKIAADAGLPVLETGRSELDRLTDGAVHQGLALRVRPYQYAHPDDLVTLATDAAQLPLIVALDGVTDPHNLGAVVRSAAAFGSHGVVVPGRRSAGVTAGAWKASAGALARTPVAQAANLARALTAYQEAGLFVVGLAADGDTGIGRDGDRGGPARAGDRLGGARPFPAGGRAMRPARPDPHRDDGVAERERRGRNRAVRGGQAPRHTRALMTRGRLP